MEILFFDSWNSIFRTLINTTLAYVAMIILLRVSGKRTLSKMNAFDFVVTIALGSTLATVSLNKNVALFDGILAFCLFIFLQYGITWLSVRYESIQKLVTSTPTLLLYKGEMLHDVLKKERISEDEIYLAARKSGITNLNEIYAIVLETTGKINVIKEGEKTEPEKKTIKSGAMKNVANHS